MPEVVQVGDIGATTEWGEAVRSVDVVVHLAAHVHCPVVPGANDDGRFMAVNAMATERLARLAAASGVRRFIFLSSVKVNGERTVFRENGEGTPYTEDDIPSPEDPYAVSKWEAEQRLAAVAAATGMEIVVVRPPLVYGPGAKANLWRLLRLVESGVPLPLGSVRNARSLVFLDNLVDFIVHCLRHPAAAGQTFLVTDGRDLSTPDLIRHLGAAMGKSAKFFPFPIPLLRWAAYVSRRSAEVDRLCGSLQADSRKAHNLLGWSPRFTVAEGIAVTVEWYLHYGSNYDR